jgi:hypothetical protein
MNAWPFITLALMMETEIFEMLAFNSSLAQLIA